MKKNFFKKKLASALALAMVVATLAPAGLSASAASATHVVKQGGAKAPTVMYVGGAKTDYGLSQVYKSNKYTWTISDSSIASITAKTGVVTAKAPGTVTIKATARNSKGKWLNSFSHKITIKQRVDSIDIGSEDFTLVMGEEKDLDAVKNPTTSTDAVRYYSDNTDVVEVNAKNGVVTTVGVGEATVTVYSKAMWNTATASTYNRTDSVKVTVIDGIQSVKQTTPSKLEVTLATDQSEKLTKDNLVITDANGIKQVIKAVTFSSDGKLATAELFISLTDKATYKVAYADTVKEFVASVGDVASIVLSSKTVQYSKATALPVKLYDANGVDVTTSDELRNVTFEYDAAKAYIDTFDGDDYNINVYSYPVSVSVKATYHTYDYTAGTEKVFESTGVINSVEELPSTASNIKYTLATDSADWNKINTTIPATAQEYKIFIKAKNEADEDITEADFDFESSDPSILTVSDTGSTVYVYPVKSGTAYIKVTYGKTVQVLPVTVGVESKAATISLSTPSATLYDSFNDSVKVKVTVKDQYGNKMTSTDTVDVVASSTTGNPINVTTGVGEVTFSLPAGVNKNGSYTYRLTYLDRSVNFTIRTVDVTDMTVKSMRLEASTNTLDVVMSDGEESKLVTFGVFEYNAKGEKVSKVVLDEDLFTITKDNKTVLDKYSFSADATVASFAALEVGTVNQAVTQAAVGTYVVKYNSTNVTTTPVTFSVTNSQVAPTVKQDKYTSTETNLEALIRNAFTASGDKNIVGFEAIINGKTVTDFNDTTVELKAGVTVNIKKLIVEESFTNGNVNHEITSSFVVRIVE